MRKPRCERMSAGLPPIADIARRGWHGRRVPIAAVSGCSKLCMWKRDLLDDLVGAGEQRGRDVDAKRLGRFEIDRKLIPGRSFYRQISRPHAS
jgi:hypothetical protein